MRIQIKSVLMLMVALGTVGVALAEEKGHRAFVPGTKITLKARKAQYLLGENILLDYEIEHDGEDAISFGTSTGLGSRDCTVVVLDADGKKAPVSTRPVRYTGQSWGPIRRGHPERFTIPLTFYCRIENPGRYRVRAAHNMHWTNRQDVIAEDDPRWAETVIEVGMPEDAQARNVVEQMLQAKEDVTRYQSAFCTLDIHDYADFTCLRFPVYLPILEKMADDARADRQALLGIAHNPTPEATQALIRLLETTDSGRLKRVVAALCDRVPESNGSSRPDRRNPIQSEVIGNVILDRDADTELVKGSWNDDISVPGRQFARKALADDDPEIVQCATYILEAIGVQEDMPELVAALNRLVPIVEGTEPPEIIGEVDPSHQACLNAIYAVEAMAGRGVNPQADPRTPGEIIQFIATLKQRKDFRPKDWEKHCQDWVRNETPYVRDFVLFNTPHPLPGSLLDLYQDGTRKVIATTHDQATIHAAVRSALEFSIPVDELLGMLVERIDSNEYQLYVHIYSCLEDLLVTGKHEHAYGACTRPLSEKEVAAVQARWSQFLKDQGQAIRNGKRFDRHSAEFRRLM